MPDTSSSATENLNHLIIIANDGRLGYKEAAEYAENPILKASFLRYATERSEFAGELTALVTAAGTAPENGSGPLGALHRVWIDIKTSFTAQNDAGLLEDCIRGDKTAVSAYKTALEDAALSADLQLVLKRHLRLTEDALFDLQQQSASSH
ncbi:ferritin-like domain-containing protein [Mucilaginibacter sp.]